MNQPFYINVDGELPDNVQITVNGEPYDTGGSGHNCPPNPGTGGADPIFLLSHRLHQKQTDLEHHQAKQRLRQAAHGMSGQVNFLSDNTPHARADMRQLVRLQTNWNTYTQLRRQLHGDLILEAEVPITPFNRLEYLRGQLIGAPPAGAPVPLVDAAAQLFVETHIAGHPFPPVPYNETVRSTAMGEIQFPCDDADTPQGLVVTPRSAYWQLGFPVTQNHDCYEVSALPLAELGLGWWQEMIGAGAYNPARGDGINVGVLDSGCGPNPFLAHVRDLGSFVDGRHDGTPGAGFDITGHGSHVLGIIGSRPEQPNQYAGLAPGVALYSGRVFGASGTCTNGDLAFGIDAMTGWLDNGLDLLNLSLGAPYQTEVVLDAVKAATARGTLIICAAGNSGGPVNMPASFDETLAVGAIGRSQTYPYSNLLWANMQPADPGRNGNWNGHDYFVPEFSCHGAGLDCVAPGVAIISNAPLDTAYPTATSDFPFVAKDGTSMASPWVCGYLATVLSDNADYRWRTNRKDRAAKARQIFDSIPTTNLGIADGNLLGRRGGMLYPGMP